MKPIARKPIPRRFHQARWDEPIIFELSQPGGRGILVPEVDTTIEEEVGDVELKIPQNMRRETPPARSAGASLCGVGPPCRGWTKTRNCPRSGAVPKLAHTRR